MSFASEPKNKNLMLLGLLTEIRKSKKIIGVSFELDEEYQQIFDDIKSNKKELRFEEFGNLSFVFDQIKKNNEPL